jgi:hypothetical protein
MEEGSEASDVSTDGSNQGSAWQKGDRLSRGRREKWRCRSIIQSFSYHDSPVFAVCHGLGFGRLADWLSARGPTEVEVCISLSGRCHWRAVSSCSSLVRRVLADTKHEYVSCVSSVVLLCCSYPFPCPLASASHALQLLSQRTPARLQLSPALRCIRPPVTSPWAKYPSAGRRHLFVVYNLR